MRRHTSLAAAALCLAAVSATPAHAQLLKRIKQAATEKIADKTVDKAAEKAGVSSTSPAGVNQGSQGITSTPSASSSKVEITSARITQFIDAMGPVIAAGNELRAQKAAKERLQAYATCRATTTSHPPASISSAQQAEIDRYADLVSKMTGDIVAVSASRDTIRIAQLTDSIQVLSDKQMRAMYPALAKCGPRPVERRSASVQTDYAGTITNPAPSRIPGMTPAQFGRMRERIALYLVAPTAPNDLSDAERGALGARSSDLAGIAAGFRSNLYNWKSWSELWSAWKE